MRIALIQTHVTFHPDGIGPEAYTKIELPGTGYMIHGRRDIVAKIIEFANLHSGRQVAHVIEEEYANALLLQAAE